MSAVAVADMALSAGLASPSTSSQGARTQMSSLTVL